MVRLDDVFTRGIYTERETVLVGGNMSSPYTALELIMHLNQGGDMVVWKLSAVQSISFGKCRYNTLFLGTTTDPPSLHIWPDTEVWIASHSYPNNTFYSVAINERKDND